VTITATPPRRTREQLLTEARSHVGAGSIPSTEALRQALHVRRETAAEIRSTLSRERADRRAERARQGRQALAAVARRKRPRPRPAVVLAPIPELAPAPAAELAVPALAEVTGTVRDEAADAQPVAAETPPAAAHRIRTWPILIIAAGAFVAVWAGWVGLGTYTGFGLMNLLPGIVEDGGLATIDTRITLPASMEAYSAYAFYILLHPAVPKPARRFAAWSAGGAVALGMAAQVAYHLMEAYGMTVAPAWVTAIVSCIPVAVFGLGAALRHMVRADS
jgi:hypothetical protein